MAFIMRAKLELLFFGLFLSVTTWASGWDLNTDKKETSIDFDKLCKAERVAGEIPSSPCCYEDYYRCTDAYIAENAAGLIWVRKHSGLEELTLDPIDQENQEKKEKQLKNQQEQLRKYAEKTKKWAEYDKSILSDQVKGSLFLAQLAEPNKTEFSCFKRGSPAGGYVGMKQFSALDSNVFSAAIGVKGLLSNGGVIPFFVVRDVSHFMNKQGESSRDILQFGDVNRDGTSPAYTPCVEGSLAQLNFIQPIGIEGIKNIDFVNAQMSRVLNNLALVDTTKGEIAIITKEGQGIIIPPFGVSGTPMDLLVNNTMNNFQDIYALVDYGANGFALLHGDGRFYKYTGSQSNAFGIPVFQRGAGTLHNRKADINQELSRLTGNTVNLQNPTGWR